MTNILHFAEAFAKREEIDWFIERNKLKDTGQNIRFIVTWDEVDEDA